MRFFNNPYKNKWIRNFLYGILDPIFSGHKRKDRKNYFLLFWILRWCHQKLSVPVCVHPFTKVRNSKFISFKELQTMKLLTEEHSPIITQKNGQASLWRVTDNACHVKTTKKHFCVDFNHLIDVELNGLLSCDPFNRWLIILKNNLEEDKILALHVWNNP